MKLQKITLMMFLASFQLFLAQDSQPEAQPVAAVGKVACACGPTEHWLYKVCVQNYMLQFPDAGLQVNYDSEGLSENIVQAIAMIAADLQFVDADGQLLVPTLSAKGNLLVPMSKNADFKLIKSILHEVDVTTTLSAQELYEAWTLQLQAMKTAQ